jgi:hypothetical protein
VWDIALISVCPVLLFPYVKWRICIPANIIMRLNFEYDDTHNWPNMGMSPEKNENIEQIIIPMRI